LTFNRLLYVPEDGILHFVEVPLCFNIFDCSSSIVVSFVLNVSITNRYF
jgi:hypothetical protein